MNILEQSHTHYGEAGGEDVAHQSHYEDNAIQPIEYMRANMSKEEFLAFCTGNVIKYISRYKRKNGVEDLKKARVYIGWAIDRMEQ